MLVWREMKFTVPTCKPKSDNPYVGAFAAIKAVSCRNADWKHVTKNLSEDLLPNTDVSGLYRRIPRTVARDKHNKKERELIYVAVANDFHIPFHDKKATLLWLQFIKDIQPDYVVINGDAVDFPSISRFDRTLNDEITMVDACLSARQLFALVRCLCPEAKIVFIEGNHEFRWERFWAQDKNRAMGTVASVFMTLRDVFGTREFGIQHFAYGEYFTLKNFMFKHEEKLFGGNDPAGMSARKTFQRWKCSGIVGHSHRGGTFYQNNQIGFFEVAENFCLCSLTPTWIKNPDWMHGHSLVKFSRTSDRFHITQMPIVNSKFVYGDRVYTT
jgi:hypothetical protein